MTVNPTSATNALTKMGDALKGWPLWLLGGAAVFLTLVFAIPPLHALIPPPYQGALLLAAIAAWILTVSKALSYLPALVAGRRAENTARIKFVITPVEAQSFWCIAKQTDNTFITEFAIRCMVKNRMSQPLHLMTAKVLRPKIHGDELSGMLTVRAIDSHMHGTAYTSGFYIPAGATLPASATLLFKGMPKQRDGKLDVLVEFVDADANASRARMVLPFASQSAPPYVGPVRRLLDRAGRF